MKCPNCGSTHLVTKYQTLEEYGLTGFFDTNGHWIPDGEVGEKHDGAILSNRRVSPFSCLSCDHDWGPVIDPKPTMKE